MYSKDITSSDVTALQGFGNSSTRRSSAYNSTFEQQLVDLNIFPYGYDCGGNRRPVIPDNLDYIRAMLAHPRASLAPATFTIDDFHKFQKSNIDARSESKVLSTIFPIIVGDSSIPNEQKALFKNLLPLSDSLLTIPKPDFYDGSRPTDVKKTIRDEIGKYIVPMAGLDGPMLPNFFAEIKGPCGVSFVARKQVCYDAVYGARAIHTLRSYIDPDTALDGNAYTISATFEGGAGNAILTLYATHVVASRSGPDLPPLEYHMTRLGGWMMIEDVESFRRGATAIRNAREWAQAQRSLLIAAANAKHQR